MNQIGSRSGRRIAAKNPFFSSLSREPRAFGKPHGEQDGGKGKAGRSQEQLVEPTAGKHDVAEQATEGDGEQPGDTEQCQALGAARFGNDIGAVGEKRGEQAGLGDPVDDAHHVDPGPERRHGEIEQDRSEVDHRADQDDRPSAPGVHDRADRGARQNRRYGSDSDDHADQHLVRPEVLEIAGQVNEQEERHALDQVGQGDEDKWAGEESVAGHRKRLTARRRPRVR